MNGGVDGMYDGILEGEYEGADGGAYNGEYEGAYGGANGGVHDYASDGAFNNTSAGDHGSAHGSLTGSGHGSQTGSPTAGGAARIKPLYFIYFPDNSPLFSLIPPQYLPRGVFGDIQEAIAFFSAHGDTNEAATSDTTARDRETNDSAKVEDKVVVVNCLDYYRRLSRLQKEPDAVLLQQLVALQESDATLGIRLLMPEDKNADQNLLIDLMSQGFHDFWFVASLSRSMFHTVLDTRRSFRDMEAYLCTLPPPDVPQGDEGRDGIAGFLLSSIPGGGFLGKCLGGVGGPQVKKEKGGSRKQAIFPKGDAPDKAPDLDRSPKVGSMPDLGRSPEVDRTPDFDRTPETAAQFAFPDTQPEDTVNLAMDFSVAAKTAIRGVQGLFHREAGSAKQTEAASPLYSDAAAPDAFTLPTHDTAAPFPDDATTPYDAAAPYDVAAPDVVVPLSHSAAAPGRAGSLSPGARLGGLVRRKQAYGSIPATSLPPSATVLFHSEEDCVLSYALASMTAALFASSGGKTLLVELPGSGSRLAETLGLRHPERNLHGALRHYASGETGSWRQYCFNGPELCQDPCAIDRANHSKHLPRELYFLPDNHTEAGLFPHWGGFLASLIHWAIMEEQFSYIVYIGFGDTGSRCWGKGLVCGHKVIVLSPWPAGFNAAPQLESVWRKGYLPAFDGGCGRGYIDREMKTMQRKAYFVIPRAVREDFLQMAALERDIADLSPESLACVSAMCGSFAQRDKK